MKKKLLIILLLLLSLASCTHYKARKLGGDVTIYLNPGEKLVEVTWKNNNLWYLVEPMEEDYEPKVKVFKENSNAGIFEGSVTFRERK